MMEAISELDDNARIDVIVVTRGGGSNKNLRVFNETPLCRVINNTTTPISVGVGHENDRTLADEVADKRVMAPTHVGEIVPKKDDLEATVQTAADRLDSAYERLVQVRLEDDTDRPGQRLRPAREQRARNPLDRSRSHLRDSCIRAAHHTRDPARSRPRVVRTAEGPRRRERSSYERTPTVTATTAHRDRDARGAPAGAARLHPAVRSRQKQNSMSETVDIPDDASISDKTERLEEIIAQLEDGEVSLERAHGLHNEGTRPLEELEEVLDIGEGKIIENQ